MSEATREQKIAEAQRLRDGGKNNREIAELIGVSIPTVRRWLNPGEAERDRRRSREYRRANHEAIRAYNREYNETHKGECRECGGEIYRRTARRGGICAVCHAERRDRRAQKIEMWWAEGLSMREIAARLGWTVGSLSREFSHLRKAGYDLPLRYAMRDGKRVPG